MPLKDQEVRKKLKQFSINDIYFLKSKWREWVKKRELHKFQEEAKRPNVQEVYKIFEPDKIIDTEPARFGRCKVRVKHSNNLDIVVLIDFNDTKDRIDVVTYYPESAKKRRKPI